MDATRFDNVVDVDDHNISEGGFVTYWHVEPPEMGQRHKVLEQTWHNDYTERHIFAWEPAHEGVDFFTHWVDESVLVGETGRVLDERWRQDSEGMWHRYIVKAEREVVE